jgi:hypothetical protein
MLGTSTPGSWIRGRKCHRKHTIVCGTYAMSLRGSLGPGARQSRSHGQRALLFVYLVRGGCSVYEREEYTEKQQDGQQSPVVKEGSHRILCS